MTKKIYYIFGIFSILSLSLMLQTFTPVVSLNIAIDDPENDVYYIDSVGMEIINMTKGDFHDEIDIIRFEVTGQHFNLTFADDISDWGNTHSAIIILHPDFSMSEISYPYYRISYENYSGLGFHVFFINVINSYTLEYWSESTGWVSSPSLATDIGSASDESIIADVPIGAYNITDDITCIAESSILYVLLLVEDIYQYIDIAPNKYDPFGGDGGNIPSYDLFIVLGLLFGISLIIVKKYIKKQ